MNYAKIVREIKIGLETLQSKISGRYTRRYFINNFFHKGKRYYIFRYNFGWGVMGVLKSYVFYYEWAKKEGYIPIIDLDSRYDFINGTMGRISLWDTLFEQEITVQEALKQKGTIVGAIDQYDGYLSETVEKYNSEQKPFLQFSQDNWREYYSDVYKLIAPVWKPKKESIERVECFIKNYNNMNNVVGVIMREEFSREAHEQYTGETKERYLKHPLMHSVQEIIEIVDEYIKKKKCDYIFVSSQYTDTIEKFVSIFGEKVIYIDRERKRYDYFGVVNDEFNGDDYFRHEKFIKEHQKIYTMYQQYMEETMIVSKCDYLITGPNSEAIFALGLNKGTYKDVCFLESKNSVTY